MLETGGTAIEIRLLRSQVAMGQVGLGPWRGFIRQPGYLVRGRVLIIIEFFFYAFSFLFFNH